MNSKPTAKEKADRVGRVADLLAVGHRPSRIHNIIAGEFGVTTRTCDNYIAQARDLLIAESGQPREFHIASALSVYRAILRDKKASNTDRISAQSRIDRLLGLEAPRRLAHEGADGGPIQVEDRTRAPRILEDPELHERASELALQAAKRLSEASDIEDEHASLRIA